MRLYHCEKCGHRNYVTAADLEADRKALRDGTLGQPVKPYSKTFSAVGMIRRLLNLK